MKAYSPNFIQTILEAILKHEGSEDPIQVSELAQLVPLESRDIRRIVSYLVNEMLYPIGSRSDKPAGFFIVKDLDDFLDAISNLDPRSKKIKDRAKNLIQACRKANIHIPEVYIKKYQDRSKIVVHINNSVVFIGNDKQIVK